MYRRKFIELSLKSLLASAAGTIILQANQDGGLDCPDHEEEIIQAFIEVIVPGCDFRNEAYLKGFYDKTLPFAKYRKHFVRRIYKVSCKLGNTLEFHKLTLNQRTKVIEMAENGGPFDTGIFHAAIFLVQISVYSGLYSPDSSAKYIGFEGPVISKVGNSQWHYKRMEKLDSPLTADGNYR